MSTPNHSPDAPTDPPQPGGVEQAQARFIAHMSHELRTPLAGLLGLVDLAHRVATDPGQRRYLEVAMQSGRVLQRTIDAVLAFASARDARLPLADEAFDVADLAAEVLRAAMPSVRARGLSVRFDWNGERTWARGDPLHLRQVVSNLIDNAARFTQHGHIAVVGELSGPVEPGQRNRLTIHVADTGPGIAEDWAERIFEAFEQGDASLSREHGGVGLGLSIARTLARRMGGDVALSASCAQGSTFTLTVPLNVADDPDPMPTASDAGHAWLVYRVTDIGQWLQRRLQRLGWTSELVPQVAAATARARELPLERHPALIIIAEHALADEIDLEPLRAALPATRIELLIRPDWNRPLLQAQAQSLDLGLAVMPLTPRDLRLLTRRREDLVRPPAPPPAQPVDDGRGGDVLIVEDNAVNRAIVEEFLRTLGVASRHAGDGEQALAACAIRAPRLVLMDLQMPVMDGLAATREIRARQRRGDLPPFGIVALTAHAMPSDAQACRDAGMDGFLTKPLLLDTLRQELARWYPAFARR